MRAYLLDEGGQIRMIAPYVKAFIEGGLREAVPRWAKTFEPDTKHWLIDRDYEDALREAMADYFEVEHIVTKGEAIRMAMAAAATAREGSAAPRPAHSYQQCLKAVRRIYQEESELHVLPGAPWSVIEAAFRAVARLCHPDLIGPSGHTRMVAVNRAYETLKKRVGGAA